MLLRVVTWQNLEVTCQFASHRVLVVAQSVTVKCVSFYHFGITAKCDQLDYFPTKLQFLKKLITSIKKFSVSTSLIMTTLNDKHSTTNVMLDTGSFFFQIKLFLTK